MKTILQPDPAIGKPIFPTALHRRAAGVVQAYFSKIPEVDTVLVVNSCARGQAVADSDLDFAILAKPSTTTRKIASIQSRWDKFGATDPEIAKYKATSQFAHLHLDVIAGVYTPTVLELGVASDYFEIEIGNQIRYSAPLGQAGEHFQALRHKWLPYYGEKLREQRLIMLKATCQYDLDHIPRFMARQLYFQAFDILCKAFQEYLQALFVCRRVYPIAYNKWIKYQIEVLLGDPDLYRQLPPILSVSDIEGDEILGKVAIVQSLLDQVRFA